MITFKELLERVKTEEITIHTPTEEQAKTLLKALDERGYKWLRGEKLTTETWSEYDEEDTCYNFELDKKIMYGPLDWYQENNYTIIEFSEIDFKEEQYG